MNKGDFQQIVWNKQYKIWKKGNLQSKNIFDICYNARQRSFKVGEKYSSNSLYSMGYSLREYSNYYGQIYCATEHFVQPNVFRNVQDYRDNDRKILLIPSKHRRDELQPFTDKILIPYGPGVIPYASMIYSEAAMADVKSYLGKTLLVFPRHSHVGMYIMADKNEFIQYVNRIAKENAYDTVLCCLFFVDVERGAYLEYEKNGWIPVTAGHQANFDFASCLKTIISLSDHVIVQGHGSHVSYSLYLRKPLTFYPADRSIFIEGQGVEKDHNSWAKAFEDELLAEFGQYQDLITDTQYSRFDELFGYSEVLSPQQLKAVMMFAKEIENDRGICEKHIDRLLNHEKYGCIKEIIMSAMESRGGK